MSETIPTTQELVNQIIAYIEARLNQKTPASDKAYNTVLAVAIGMALTSLYKFEANRILAAFVQTATGADLDFLGAEYLTPRLPAVACVATLTLTGTNSTVIPAGTVFVSTATGALYTSNASVTIAAGTCSPVVTAQAAGADTNLNIADTLALQSAIAGATGIPTVASVGTAGADVEGDTPYRVRVLTVQQSVSTGSNAAAYRVWAQTISGVLRAYPYSGNPSATGSPPMRTVYVECATIIQADGIAPGGMLTQVRTAITTDPATGLARQDLGLTDGTLYVQAISRTQIFVQVTGLTVLSGLVAQCQAAISDALTTYFLAISPFVMGVDPAFGRNDTITNLTVGKIVQAVLTQYGATASNIGFGLSVGVFSSVYTVGQGEKAKLGGVAYV